MVAQHRRLDVGQSDHGHRGGQMRQIEFIADELGDWAMHCHKSHHTMNAMVTRPNDDWGGSPRVTRQIQELLPEYMVMGSVAWRI